MEDVAVHGVQVVGAQPELHEAPRAQQQLEQAAERLHTPGRKTLQGLQAGGPHGVPRVSAPPPGTLHAHHGTVVRERLRKETGFSLIFFDKRAAQ